MSWLLGRAGLYLLLVAALVLGPLVLQALAGTNLRDELMSPREVSARFNQLREATANDFAKRRAELVGAPPAIVNQRLERAEADLEDIEDKLAELEGWFEAVRPQAVLARKQLELREAALRGEIQLLTHAREGHSIGADLQRAAASARRIAADERARCDQANANVRAFNERSQIERSLRNAVNREAERLSEEARDQCRVGKERLAAVQLTQQLKSDLARAQSAYAEAGLETEAALSRMTASMTGTLQSVLLQAAVLLVGILIIPYLIRLAFYFVLAPLAARRPAVRLPLPTSSTQPRPISAQASATSVSLTLVAGERLLVRQGFLQTTSSTGAKATQALLDWRHSLSSLASGLSFLTRIEGAGETTTVSALSDPFAEVAVLDLPPGAACVLQPRALAALIQSSGSPLCITSHWRLGTLHAWLTLQLRYLMFHGPARLVIKGGRGVRVEPAARGRVFSQDQLVGFSADLSYSVTRTETFWPYFFGLQPLLKDRVDAGDGVLILEEAPMTAAGGARVRSGLEGAADVLLKAVGI